MRLPMLALVFALGFPRVARGERDEEPREQPRTAQEPVATAQEPARHFERALEEYRRGHYRAAIGELNEAILLDPESKDLFFNLALVHEKLGQLDRAIVAMGRYIELERDPAEAERAALTIVRLRGAEEELAAERAALASSAAPQVAPRPVIVRLEPEPPALDARLDSWIVGGAALAASAALVGVVFGARALALNASAVDAEDRRGVERSALVADVSLSVGLLAGAGTALLWWTRDPAPPVQLAGPGVSLFGTF